MFGACASTPRVTVEELTWSRYITKLLKSGALKSGNDSVLALTGLGN